MEYEKIHRLVNGGETMPDLVSKFTSKKLGGQYKENKEIRFKTSMLRADLCDYSDAYVEVTADVVVKVSRMNADNVNVFADVAANPAANPPVVAVDNSHKRTFTLKNNAPFISCITKINGELVENAEDLDVVMSMYNLTEYSKNYKKTNGSLHNYYRDEPSSEEENNINYSIKNSESYNYKAKLTQRFANFAVATAGENDDLNLDAVEVNIIVPLKHLGNFWRELKMLLINCEVEVKLKCNKNCVLVNKATRAEVGAAEEINTPKGATLNVTNCKLHVPVITLRAIDDNKLLKSLKTGFKRTITWNNYRSTITNQAINNNLNILIDPTFTKVHRLFVLAYANEDDRTSYSQYYVPNIEIKNYNVIIDGKPFFELPVKNMEETYQKIIDMGYNDDYTVGNLMDFKYFKEHYKLIAIDLNKQKELENDVIQQINFIGSLERTAVNNVYPLTTIFIIIEHREQTTIDFPQNSATIFST